MERNIPFKKVKSRLVITAEMCAKKKVGSVSNINPRKMDKAVQDCQSTICEMNVEELGESKNERNGELQCKHTNLKLIKTFEKKC